MRSKVNRESYLQLVEYNKQLVSIKGAISFFFLIDSLVLIFLIDVIELEFELLSVYSRVPISVL